MLALALSLALGQAAPAPSPSAPSIAVLRLEAAGVPQEMADSATALVPTEVRRLLPDTRVLSSEDVRTLLTHQKDRLMHGCGEDDSCVAELGGSLKVDELLAGRLGKLGESYVVELRRVEVAGQRSLGSATRTVKRPEAIGPAVVSLVGRIYGVQPGSGLPGAGLPPAGLAPESPEGGTAATPARYVLPVPKTSLSLKVAAPGADGLPSPRRQDSELELRPIKYPGTNHREVYGMVRGILAQAGLPIEREWTEDDARLRLRSVWFGIERDRRVRVNVVVDGRVSVDVQREQCGPDGCDEAEDLTKRELELGRSIHAALRPPVESAPR